MTPPITIILLNYNTKSLTLECLANVIPYATGRGWQIIVVDNASEDDSAEAIATRFPSVHLIRNDRNLGYAGGNNLGLRQANGDVVVLLNSDVIVSPEGLSSLASYLQTCAAVGAVSPRLTTAQGDPQSYAFGNDPTLPYLFQRGIRSLLRRGDVHDWKVDHPLSIDWVSGACLCVRREVIDQVGLLDENFFLYFEDVDWCLRMRQAGWQIVYNPNWSVVHFGGGSQLERYGSSPLYYESLLYFYQKHYPGFPALILRVAIAIYRWFIGRLPLRS